ncbi:hypothetical protein NV379_20040 [Paenibacillus sp. N1-5-1-14]|uniref:hypothetical protein n=1 Tax=Paenibacillus radicibacter TaxID=2972488 RepID=UPI0021593E92|nr:hypothetical protein [Paenibacillus radicibacter]MCR8644948.1 hypothetical protein [Paenibacillus radicibacter]
MGSQEEFILIVGHTEASEFFMKELQRLNKPFVVLTNNKVEQKKMLKSGIANIVRIDTSEHSTWLVPEHHYQQVYVFEQSLPLCCRFIQICRSWTNQPIYVITKQLRPRLIYRGLGANYVIHSHSDDVTFLLAE